MYISVMYISVMYISVMYISVMYISVMYKSVMYISVMCISVMYISVMYISVMYISVRGNGISSFSKISFHNLEEFRKCRFFVAFYFIIYMTHFVQCDFRALTRQTTNNITASNMLCYYCLYYCIS